MLPAFLAHHTASAPAPAPAAEPAGMLFVVRCEPDPFTAETLNVGVFGVAHDGRRHARTITQPGRLDCLYGPAAGEVVWLAQAAHAAALAGSKPPSPQLRFDGPMPYFHDTLEAAVDRAFDELVTVALPDRRREVAPPRVSDGDALADVIAAIKHRLPMHGNLVANTPDVLLDTDRGPWAVRIPLQPRDGVGVIRSADYGADTLKAHLLESVVDLECAAHYRHKRGMGLFVLRPPQPASADLTQVDALLDGLFRRKPPRLVLEVADTADALADHIVHWGAELNPS